MRYKEVESCRQCFTIPYSKGGSYSCERLNVTEHVKNETLSPDCPLPTLTVIEGCEGCEINETLENYPDSCCPYRYGVEYDGKPCPFKGMTVKFPEGTK